MNHRRRIRRLPALHLSDLPPGVADAELPARWVADRDEAAFELLVRRHAPAVLAACRRLLADRNDADALPDVTVAGRVARVGFVVDPQYRTVRAEIDLPNLKGDIRPGMTGSVSVKLGKGPAHALRVPVTALLGLIPAKKGDPGLAVYVVKDGKARLTPVRLGHQNEKEAEVLSGLTADDLVVVEP